MNFKQSDLVDQLNRGVTTDICKLCGAKIGDLGIHLKWHNELDRVLKRLIQVSHGIR